MSQRTTPLILVPGLLCDPALWRHQSAHLTDIADCQIVDVTGRDRIEDMAADILASAPEQFALAGLSMGGYVALDILRQAPERVLKLALLDTHAHADSPEQSAQREKLIALAQDEGLDSVMPLLLPRMIHPARLDDSVLVNELQAMAARVGPQAFVRQQQAIMHRRDYRESLADIYCPTVVIGGRDDVIAPLDRMAEMAAGVRNGRLAIIEDCGHMATMEQPQAATALLRDWLVYQQ